MSAELTAITDEDLDETLHLLYGPMRSDLDQEHTGGFKRMSTTGKPELDSDRMKTMRIVNPANSRETYLVENCPAGLFGHLAREAARTTPQVFMMLRELRRWDYRYVSDRVDVIRFLIREGAALPWLPDSQQEDYR